MKKPKPNYLNLFLIIFAFVLFLSGAYYLGKQSSVVPTVTTDPTVNWKTYKTINNLSFDIPSDWQEQKNSSISSVDGKMAIWIENSAMGLTCLEKTKQTSNTVVNKKVEIEYYQGLTNENCTNPTDRLIFISLNSISPKFSFSFSYNQNNQTEAEKIFTQILSTFKFTEGKATNSTIKQSGYIRDLIKNGTLWTANFEPVEILNESQCKARGIQAPNLNCIIESKQTIGYEISPNVSVIVFSLHHLADGNFKFNEKISYDDFLSYMLNYSSPELKSSLYSIEILNNQISKISEQFQP